MAVRYTHSLIACLCVVALCQARADEPHAAPTEPSLGSTPAAVPPDKAAQLKADAAARTAAQDARYRALGYKPITRNGVRLYCHDEEHIGSRLLRTVCATPEQLELAAQTRGYAGPAGLIGLSGIKFN